GHSILGIEYLSDGKRRRGARPYWSGLLSSAFSQWGPESGPGIAFLTKRRGGSLQDGAPLFVHPQGFVESLVGRRIARHVVRGMDVELLAAVGQDFRDGRDRHPHHRHKGH